MSNDPAPPATPVDPAATPPAATPPADQADPTLDDLAGELDDPSLGPDTDPPDTDDDYNFTYDGVCVGGPYDGYTVSSRCPKGFVLVDRPNNRMWMYDFFAPSFTCRVGGAQPISGLDAYGDGSDYDVLAYDGAAP
jgi:hypothetical protein